MDTNQELKHFKELVSVWLAAHLSVLEAGANVNENMQRIEDAEKQLAQETLKILHDYQIDTEALENAVRDARQAAMGTNGGNRAALCSDLDAVMARLKREMSRIVEMPVIEPLIENLRGYYRSIFTNPELAARNQELYEKCLNIILHPAWVNANPTIMLDMKRMFKNFITLFLAEEQKITRHENTPEESSSSSGSSSCWVTVDEDTEPMDENNEDKEDKDENMDDKNDSDHDPDKPVSYDESKTQWFHWFE